MSDFIMNMTYPYNLTQLQNASTITSVVDYVVDISGGQLFQIGIICIFIIMMLALKRYGFENAVTVSAYLCFILSMFLTYLDYINFIYVIVFLTVSVLGTFWLWIKPSY